jgi:class 3 adenylate cyclase/tetratricopeptide (TPR) repeat protein
MPTPIETWLAGLGLQRYADAFIAAAIDVDVLSELTDADLVQLGVALGDRKRMLRAIRLGTPAPVDGTGGEPDEPSYGERRQLTIIFCDIVGSTALAARLDPEDLREVISTYHARCTEIVSARGGEVMQFLGDGVMVAFGYPHSFEDDAERAVRCAIEMLDAVRACEFRNGVRLEARAGIATGTEVVGDSQGAPRDRASVVGATPSLASRLQSLAEPNGIVIANGTRRLLGGAFALTPLGATTVKGIDEPIEVWRVDRELRGATRFAALTSSASRFVGREFEIALLADRWRSACAGEGQVVLLVAEGGVGKSRIVEEFVRSGEGTSAAVVRFQCHPHYAGSALYPIRAAIEYAAEIASSDKTAERFAKLSGLSARFARPLADTDAIAWLLALPGADELPRVRALSDQDRRMLVFHDLLACLETSSAHHPVLLIIEDVHWVDPTTLELLTHVILALRKQRVMLTITARPEFTSPWSHHGHITTHVLNRLGRSAVETLVVELCGEKSLPDEVLEQIVERADGVALFAEELTKAVLESTPSHEQSSPSALSPTHSLPAIPETLGDALAARLELLAPVRDIAQVGAVIGRDFSEELLVAVSGAEPDAIRGALDRLESSGLILSTTTATGTMYSFKHALVRDAAYSSLLRPRRQDLHRQVARSIVTRFASIATTVPEIVAHHLEEGGNGTEALDYWIRAADGAIARSAYREAAAHFRRALGLRDAFPDDGGATELDLLNRLGIVYFVLEGGTSKIASELYERGELIAGTLPESRATFGAQLGRCFCAFMSGRNAEARARAAHMIQVAERLGDNDLMLEALHARWSASILVGDLESVITTTARAAQIYDPARHHSHVTKFGTGHDSGVCGRGQRAMALMMTGCIDEGRRTLDDLKSLLSVLSHPFSHCIGLGHWAVALETIGEYDAAIATANECRTLAAANKFAMSIGLASVIAGAALVDSGDRREGIALMKSVLDGSTSSVPTSWRPTYLARLAVAEYADGDRDAAFSRIEAAESLRTQMGGCLAEPELFRARATLLRASGASRSAVREQLDAAEALARAQGSLLYAMRAATDRVLFSLDPEMRAADMETLGSLVEHIAGGDDTPLVRAAREALAAR